MRVIVDLHEDAYQALLEMSLQFKRPPERIIEELVYMRKSEHMKLKTLGQATTKWKWGDK
jgi:hypothetical protein